MTATSLSSVEVNSEIAGISGSEHDQASRADVTRQLVSQFPDAPPETKRELQNQLAEVNLGVAESLARRYRDRGESLEDLVQVATVGLMKAARGFDPDKADDFLTYAVPTITGELKRHFRDRGWMVRPPRRIQDLQARISHATSDLSQILGRSPTTSEIADALDEEEQAVLEALATDGCFTPTSIDNQPRDGDGMPLTDQLGTEEGGFDRSEAVVALAPACRHLGERDRYIVYLRFFRGWSQQEIADVLGVTQMQVSRLLARILSDLREELGVDEERRVA